jgi:putative lipoic acid-binding regulatory protein
MRIIGEFGWNFVLMENYRDKLRVQLEQNYTWPTVYMFKFIVPAENDAIARVQNLFNTGQAEVSQRPSSNGKFVSITAVEMMLTPDSVLERYAAAEGIPGLISL